MAKYFKFLLSFFILLFQLSLSAEEEVSTSTPSAGQTKVLHTKYISYPSSVHSREKFSVKIEANILLPEEQEFSLFTDIPDVDNLEKKTNEVTWHKKDATIYEATITFQAKDAPFVFPVIEISILSSDNTMIDKALLIIDNIPFNPLLFNKDLYANISASTIDIQNLKVKQYNNDELLCSMEIHAKNSNLEDFRLPYFVNQGSKGLVSKNGEQTLYYFVIVPLDTTILQFEYFNTSRQALAVFESPIIMDEDLVSTQTDLNPNAGNLGFYKKVFVAFITTILLMIYYYKRYKAILFLLVIFIIMFIGMMLPNSHMMLKKDQKVYILPTLNSTVFKIIKEEEDVEVLLDKNGFKKVLFQNTHIGWIKNE